MSKERLGGKDTSIFVVNTHFSAKALVGPRCQPRRQRGNNY
jgi:hypothetical protein